MFFSHPVLYRSDAKLSTIEQVLMQVSQSLPFAGLPYPSINGMPNLPISPGGLKQEVASDREIKQLKRKQVCLPEYY